MSRTPDLEPIRTFFSDGIRLDLVRDNIRYQLFLRISEFVENAYYSGRQIKSQPVTCEFNEDTGLMDEAFDMVVERIKNFSRSDLFENATKLLPA